MGFQGEDKGMPKRHLEARTQEDRAKQRQGLGSPQDLTVQPATKARYKKAIDGFLQFLTANKITLPNHVNNLILCFVITWSIYGRKAMGVTWQAIRSLEDHDFRLRGQLRGAWRLLKTWSLNEIPNRAPPLPEHVLHAMVGWSFFHQHFGFGVSLLLGYYAMLRTGELLGLTANHPFL